MKNIRAVELLDGTIANVLKIVNEPITHNTVYIIDTPYEGPQDIENYVNRKYFSSNGEDGWFVYPGEVKSVFYEAFSDNSDKTEIKETKLPDDIIYSNGAQEEFIKGVRSVIMEMTEDEELIENTPRRLLKAFDEWFKDSNTPLETIAKQTCKTFDSDNTDLIIADNIEVFCTCCHHCCPYSTTIAIGVIPDGKVMGLSKYSRVVKRVARRFDSGMVENLVTNIYKVLKEGLGTDNIMVVAYSKPGQVHTCAASRGANDTNMRVTSSAIHGLFVANPELKREFLSLINKN